MADITNALPLDIAPRPGFVARHFAGLALVYAEARQAIAEERRGLRLELDFRHCDPRSLRDIGLDRSSC